MRAALEIVYTSAVNLNNVIAECTSCDYGITAELVKHRTSPARDIRFEVAVRNHGHTLAKVEHSTAAVTSRVACEHAGFEIGIAIYSVVNSPRPRR